MIRVMHSVAELTDYFRRLIAQRRTTPTEDLLQDLITAAEQDNRCVEEEVIANCILFLIAGYDSTAHLLDGGLLVLLQHPEQLHLLRDDLSLMPAAVTEMLRYDSPVQTASRRAKADLRIGDKQISNGQAVIMCLGAANRDPARFTDPDQFHIRRPDNRPLSFGYGVHVCPGAPLARLQAEIALSTLLRCSRDLRLETTALEWDIGVASRVLKRLPITCA
jgi:cytochrome P450